MNKWKLIPLLSLSINEKVGENFFFTRCNQTIATTYIGNSIFLHVPCLYLCFSVIQSSNLMVWWKWIFRLNRTKKVFANIQLPETITITIHFILTKTQTIETHVMLIIIIIIISLIRNYFFSNSLVLSVFLICEKKVKLS